MYLERTPAVNSEEEEDPDGISMPTWIGTAPMTRRGGETSFLASPLLKSGRGHRGKPELNLWPYLEQIRDTMY